MSTRNLVVLITIACTLTVLTLPLTLPLRRQLAELRAAQWLGEPVTIDMETLAILNSIERRLNS